jgi:hypothetical protein
MLAATGGLAGGHQVEARAEGVIKKTYARALIALWRY